MRLALLTYTFHASEKHKFGIEFFKEHDIEVDIISCSSFFYSSNSPQENFSFLYSPQSLNEFESLIIERKYDHVLINFPYNFQSKSIYDVLWKSKIKISLFALDYWPIALSFSAIPTTKRLIRNIIYNFQLMFHPRFEHFFSPVSFYPDTAYLYKKSKKIHALNSYEYLELAEKKLLRSIEKDYFVFIDQYWPYHPDFFALEKKSPIEGNAYFRDLKKIFYFLENHFKKQVIIAAHPKADIEKIKHQYHPFQIIQNQSLELISHSEFVLGHYSTSLAFAAILQKPVFLIDFSYLAFRHKQFINNLSKLMEIPSIEIDQSTEKELISFFSKPYQPTKNFIKNYLAETPSNLTPYWKQVIEVLQQEKL